MRRLSIFLAALVVAATALAQRPTPKQIAVIDGEPVYQVLPLDAIPAIRVPEFVSGAAADRQMRDGEPVLGVVVGDQAHAYSLWHLDAHEIVNDTISGTAIAATW